MAAGVIGIFLLLMAAHCAFAQDGKPLRGVALVIGQSDYEHLAPLPNPENDADAIETLLSDLGFDSVRRTDRDAETLARDLERFAQDAEDADVAVLYYSGHGIEAGGENFLVPVDADLTALDAADQKLVPVSAFIDRLKATVPVVIVMLDACRDNPFPAGSQLRLSGNAQPMPVGAGGLGLSRGATSLKAGDAASAPADANVGTVVAFAAEPGKVALDGTAGGNSPYAAAVLRHFDAMAGEEFGTVMRMVAEEVYLKTGGRQRPWINESLRRLLYFGEKPEELSGDQGDILRERRGLLITIAALPDPERRSIEKVAASSSVPIDAVYGMLKAMGTDAPKDPAKLEDLLREQAAKVAELFSREQTLSHADPELARLSALTDDALREGAMDTAARLRQAVDRRIAELDTVVEDAEAQIKARRMEFAGEYVRSAQIAIARFDRLAAADYYALAFEQVERWDDDFAMRARNSEVEELRLHALMSGDQRSLERGIAVGREAIALSERAGGVKAAAAARVNVSLLVLQSMSDGYDAEAFAEAIGLVRSALPVHTQADAPSLWVVTYHALGHMLQTRGFKTSSLTDLAEAEAIFRELSIAPAMRENRSLWSKLHGNLGSVLLERSRLSGDVALLQPAYDVVATGIAGTDATALPVDWAYLQQVAGAISLDAAGRGAGAEAAANAVTAYRATQTVFDKEHYPTLWVDATRQLAQATFSLGDLTNEPVVMEQAVSVLRSVGTVVPRETKPDEWALDDARAGAMFYTLYEQSRDTRHLREANAAYEAALQAAGGSAQALVISSTLADTLVALAFVENDPSKIERSASMMRDILAKASADTHPHDLALARSKLAEALYHLGNSQNDTARIEEAIALYNSMDPGMASTMSQSWIGSRSYLADALAALGRVTRKAEPYESAAAVYAELQPLVVASSNPGQLIDLKLARAGMLAQAAYLSAKPQPFETAVAAYLEVLPSADSTAYMQVDTRERLAQVTIDLGVMTNDRHRVAQGRAHLSDAATLLREKGDRARADQIAAMISRVDQWLSGAQ